jgi:hypothetical protein
VSNKKIINPAWWKNTYFWIAGILLVLGIIGMPFFAGDEVIRDPGQKRENGLALMYLGGALIMFINGWISHRQTMQAYEEEFGAIATAKPVERAVEAPEPDVDVETKENE